MKAFLKVSDQGPAYSIAILMIRLVVGLAFMLHGYGKIQNPFSWMGPDAGTPGIFQALAAFSEFGGGLAWILGLLAPLASLGILSTMTVAVFTHAIIKGDPFVGKGGSYELALVYWCVALVILCGGVGKFSLDRKIFGNR